VIQMTQFHNLESRVPEISEYATAASTCYDSGKFSPDSPAQVRERGRSALAARGEPKHPRTRHRAFYARRVPRDEAGSLSRTCGRGSGWGTATGSTPTNASACGRSRRYPWSPSWFLPRWRWRGRRRRPGSNRRGRGRQPAASSRRRSAPAWRRRVRPARS
jgi:hypothetical protein